MGTIAFVIKVLLTIALSYCAVLSASKSIEEAHPDQKISRWACGIVAAIGLIIGLIAIGAPTFWPLQIPCIGLLVALQLLNNEGKNRATSWSMLALLSGVMMFIGMVRWQNTPGLGGIRFWMLAIPIILAGVPIVIGLYRGFILNHVAEEEGDGKIGEKIVKLTSENKKVVALAIGCCFALAFLVSAVAWLTSMFS